MSDTEKPNHTDAGSEPSKLPHRAGLPGKRGEPLPVGVRKALAEIWDRRRRLTRRARSKPHDEGATQWTQNDQMISIP